MRLTNELIIPVQDSKGPNRIKIVPINKKESGIAAPMPSHSHLPIRESLALILAMT
jgi:hypothetical protein